MGVGQIIQGKGVLSGVFISVLVCSAVCDRLLHGGKYQ